ncbi:hypothetical protein [Alicyclobacillus dauci]|uniref:Uncharacterized protein n=1 Tax=Alicyclobacillus dauci TaxID=1475485 RepID=A0ABY6Z5J2_9BACL|nr:hypothetical protein [Alicyclobacillus dauci]WAH38034.1 hypothetical protein NZD86_05975 [Alicyclobacillus dauci]
MQSQSPRQTYTARNLFYEYFIFLVGSVIVGAMVAWAEWPHGTTRALAFGVGAGLLAAIYATVGLMRRRATLRRYVQRTATKADAGVSL